MTFPMISRCFSIALAFFIAGAASVPARSPTPASLPEIGTTFVFSDGRVERVVGHDASSTRWASRRGGEYVRPHNVALPILEWEVGGRQGVRRVYGEQAGFWPPVPGQRDRFRVVTEVTGDKGVERTIQLWTCAAGAIRSVATPSGPFEAMPITCDRFSTSNMTLIERRIWFWSAEIGHYVRRDFQDLGDGTLERIVLCEALPPRNANRIRIDAAAEKKC